MKKIQRWIREKITYRHRWTEYKLEQEWFKARRAVGLITTMRIPTNVYMQLIMDDDFLKALRLTKEGLRFYGGITIEVIRQKKHWSKLEQRIVFESETGGMTSGSYRGWGD